MENNILNYKINYIYNQSLIPENKRKHIGLVFDNDGTDKEEFVQLKKISNDIINFVKRGHNLYIHSQTCGNGKSSWALNIANEYITKIAETVKLECKVLFISVPYFLNELKRNITEKSDYIEHVNENIYKANLVIWDDICVKNASTFDADQLFSILDNRLVSGKSNIFTSNLSEEEIHLALGDRLASRICSSSYEIVLNGRDKRTLQL